VANRADRPRPQMTLRHLVGTAVLVGLLGALSYVGWPLVRSGFGVGGAPSPLESRWRTEEHWLVDSIVRDLAEMARFAADSRPPAAGDVDVAVAFSTPGAGPVKVGVTLAPGRQVEHAIGLATFIWSPEEYRELARALLAAAGVTISTPATSSNGTSALNELTDLRAPVIEQVNQRNATDLARSFNDPGIHETAALVLGALALREGASEYADARATLCRITAHLALADAFRAGSERSLDGRVANAALLVLAGRGADAAAALDELDRAPEKPGLRAWCRGLRLRLTDDIRIRPQHATFLERRELYGAIIRAGDSPAAAEFARDLGLDGTTDAWRLAAELGFTVEAGNALLPQALGLELSEIGKVWALARGGKVADDELVIALNHPTARGITLEGPRAIGWGTWAAAFQRQIVTCLSLGIHHWRHTLGHHAGADRQLRDAERFSRMTLYPLVETRGTADASRRPARLDDLITLMIEQPERVNAMNWYMLAPLARDEVVRRGMPSREAWFVPAIPRGTTHEIPARRHARLLPRDPKQLDALRAISPQDFYIVDAFVAAKFGAKGSIEEVDALFGERVHYDQRVFRRLASVTERDPAALETVLRRACALIPYDCFSLGYLLVEKGDAGGAAKAYQRGLDGVSDAVIAANHCGWLVGHYLDTGQRERARAIAAQAAATGAAEGLLTMARYFERTGDFERSEALLNEEVERYGNDPQLPAEREESKDGEQDQDDLIAFHYRMAYKRNQARYEKRFLDLTAGDFPNGLERADLKAFSGYPTDGTFVLTTSPRAERAGLKAGDIIVALDGFRVRTRRQYYVVRGFGEEPTLSLIIFRHPRYVELKARSADRRLGFDFRSHRASAPRAQGQ